MKAPCMLFFLAQAPGCSKIIIRPPLYNPCTPTKLSALKLHFVLPLFFNHVIFTRFFFTWLTFFFTWLTVFFTLLTFFFFFCSTR